MLKLVPITENEYPDFMQIASRTFKQDQIKAGNWKDEGADARMKAKVDQILSNGLHTPNHFIYTIQELVSNARVGDLWFSVMEMEGLRSLFVFFIQIHPESRRMGLGSQAFKKMEEMAKELNIKTINLNVFEHNLCAREMYLKLGYRGSVTGLSKTINT